MLELVGEVGRAADAPHAPPPRLAEALALPRHLANGREGLRLEARAVRVGDDVDVEVVVADLVAPDVVLFANEVRPRLGRRGVVLAGRSHLCSGRPQTGVLGGWIVRREIACDRNVWNFVLSGACRRQSYRLGGSALMSKREDIERLVRLASLWRTEFMITTQRISEQLSDL